MSTVPANYAFSPYVTEQDLFADVAEFQLIPAGTSGGTAVNDPTIVKGGVNSIAVTPDINLLKEIQKTEDITIKNGRVGIWIYVKDHTKLKATAGVQIYFGNVNNYADGFVYTYIPTYNGFQFIQLTGNDFTQLGNGTWDLKMVRWKVRVSATATETTTVNFCSFYHDGGQARGKVLITFDDGEESQYLVARDILNAAGLKSSFSVVESLIGTGGFMTEANLQTLYSEGNSICTHGLTNLTTLSISDAQADVESNRDYVGTIDPEGALHYVYPQGDFEYSSTDTQIVDMLTSINMKTGRTTFRAPQVISTIQGLEGNMTLPIAGHVLAVDTLQELLDRVDLAYQTGASVIFMFHKVVPVATLPIEISTADFQAFCDHVQYRMLTNRIDNPTIVDWHNGLDYSRALRS